MLTTIARILMVGVAALTSLSAVVAAVLFVLNTEDPPFLLAQLASCAFVVCVGVLTALHTVSGFGSLRELLFAAAVTLAVFSVIALVTSIRVGQTTGEFDYYAIFALVALIGQGVLTAGCSWSEPEPTQPSGVTRTAPRPSFRTARRS